MDLGNDMSLLCKKWIYKEADENETELLVQRFSRPPS